jgi:hypothetical protein
MAHSRAFAAVLRQHRLAAGYSQEALAERAGLSRRGISDNERGLKRTPQWDTEEGRWRSTGIPTCRYRPLQAGGGGACTRTPGGAPSPRQGRKLRTAGTSPAPTRMCPSGR